MSEQSTSENKADVSATTDAHWNPELKKEFGRLFGPDAVRIGRPVEGMSVGQVSYMAIPETWKSRTPNAMPAGAGLVEYHPPGTEDVRLNSFYRGRRIDPETGLFFHQILQAIPHELNQEERTKLQVVFDDKGARDFEARSVRTVDLNGRRVLLLLGIYKAEPVMAQTVYIDSDGTGTAVQELTYSAPERLYEQYKPQAEKSFRSIKWTENPR